jgi:hypothetical protein
VMVQGFISPVERSSPPKNATLDLMLPKKHGSGKKSSISDFALFQLLCNR